MASSHQGIDTRRARKNPRTSAAPEPLTIAIRTRPPRERPEIQNKRMLRVEVERIKEAGVSDAFSAAGPAFPSDGSTETSATDRAAETIRSASHTVSDAIEAGREPDVPLDILAKLVREAPLPALPIAFLLGVVVARRR
jgi:hypothetical protein